MAKLEDIIKQLQAVLPKYTDYFNENLLLNSINYISGSTFEIETSIAHGLSTGWYINLENVLSKNEIITITDLGDNKIKLKTNVKHDLTENFNIKEQKHHTEEIYLYNFDNLSDGYYTLLTVPLADELIVSLPVVPTGTGYLCEDRIDGINGRYQINVIDSTKFRIDVPNSNFTDFLIITGSKIISKIRVSGVGAPDRFIEYYSKQQNINDFWAFVANGETRTSFDRQIASDANQRKDKSDDFRCECIQPFFVYVLAPKTDKYGARYISDIMIDIRKYLCKSLCGVAFPSGFDTEEVRFLTTFTGDNFFDYAGAYYIHIFEFETVYNFNPQDGVDILNTRAFREFEINFKLQFDDYENIKKQIKGELP